MREHEHVACPDTGDLRCTNCRFRFNLQSCRVQQKSHVVLKQIMVEEAAFDMDNGLYPGFGTRTKIVRRLYGEELSPTEINSHASEVLGDTFTQYDLLSCSHINILLFASFPTAFRFGNFSGQRSDHF